jgi:hypothetical protein
MLEIEKGTSSTPDGVEADACGRMGHPADPE